MQLVPTERGWVARPELQPSSPECESARQAFFARLRLEALAQRAGRVPAHAMRNVEGKK